MVIRDLIKDISSKRTEVTEEEKNYLNINELLLTDLIRGCKKNNELEDRYFWTDSAITLYKVLGKHLMAQKPDNINDQIIEHLLQIIQLQLDLLKKLNIESRVQDLEEWKNGMEAVWKEVLQNVPN